MHWFITDGESGLYEGNLNVCKVTMYLVPDDFNRYLPLHVHNVIMHTSNRITSDTRLIRQTHSYTLDYSTHARGFVLPNDVT